MVSFTVAKCPPLTSTVPNYRKGLSEAVAAAGSTSSFDCCLALAFPLGLAFSFALALPFALGCAAFFG